jgi:hypothetical protein
VSKIVAVHSRLERRYVMIPLDGFT